MKTINTKVNTEKEWMIEDRTIYCLHESGRYTKGEPELCNEFYFSVQPDYGRGITNEMAEEQAKNIYSSIVNHHALVEALTNMVAFYEGDANLAYIDKAKELLQSLK